MARLIDADALKEAMNYNGGCGICFRYIDNADAIDAIPVEWLRKYTAVGAVPSGERLTEGRERIVVGRILKDWQKEQEVQL